MNSSFDFAHISDSHFEEGDRLQETADVHAFAVRECAKAGVELILHTGDLFHKLPRLESREAAREFLTGAADAAPVVVVGGNHDGREELRPYNYFRTKNRVHAIQSHASFRIGNATIICLPWFDKATFGEELPLELDQQSQNRDVIAEAENMLGLLRLQAEAAIAEGRIPILAGHVSVAGSAVASGQTLIGTTIELSPAALFQVGAPYTALGHIHMQQQWERITGNSRQVAAYAGSTIHRNFGEPEVKGFYLVHVERVGGGWHVEEQFVPLPARPIELIEVDVTAVAQPGGKPMEILTRAVEQASVNGALVRVRFHLEAHRFAEFSKATLETALRNRGAYDVKIEPVPVHQSRLRSEEILNALEPWDDLVAYLNSKQISLSEHQLADLRDVVLSLQQEVLVNAIN
ncbi:MAG TPA: metallophosphoesterase [Blastocatellia bacterium]